MMGEYYVEDRGFVHGEQQDRFQTDHLPDRPQCLRPGVAPGIRPVFEWVFPNQSDPAMIWFFPGYDPGLNGHLSLILASHAGFL